MKKFNHVRKKAIELRNMGKSLLEICNILSMNKTTVYYWIKNIPLKEKTEKQNACLKKASKLLVKKYTLLRDNAYNIGKIEYKELIQEHTFRDFVMLFLTEGYRRGINEVTIANSNENLILLGYSWIKKLGNIDRKFRFSVQIHKDHNENRIKEYWSNLLGINKDLIKIIRKSNSGELNRRKWRSRYGVFTVGIFDTYLRCRMQAWMDLLQEEWRN